MVYKEEMSHTAFAFIAGATVGAGVALLFAPRAGSELRSSVREYTRRAKDEWDQASQLGDSALDTLAQRGKEWIQRATRIRHSVARLISFAVRALWRLRKCNTCGEILTCGSVGRHG
ncbi:MAG: hypothetical protein K0S45_3893 [Nitrospira sp.]|nr:hypothetical protein [Nitrospira sp.]